jgi:hypothetical protein
MFTDQTSVALNSPTISNPVTISGINTTTQISVSGGAYSVGCTSTFTTTSSTITNGQTVCVRHTSASTNNTVTNTILTVGGVSDTFMSTTVTTTAPSKPSGSFSIDKTPITAGESIVLSWTSKNTTSCTASDGWSGEKGVSGSEKRTPTSSQKFTITCTGDGGVIGESIDVTVSAAQGSSSTGNSGALEILFTDVEYGPKTGGPNNLGVPISIFGKGFGSSRGSSKVTIGGVEVGSYMVWGANNAHNTTLDMIVVQPGQNVSG